MFLNLDQAKELANKIGNMPTGKNFSVKSFVVALWLSYAYDTVRGGRSGVEANNEWSLDVRHRVLDSARTNFMRIGIIPAIVTDLARQIYLARCDAYDSILNGSEIIDLLGQQYHDIPEEEKWGLSKESFLELALAATNGLRDGVEKNDMIDVRGVGYEVETYIRKGLSEDLFDLDHKVLNEHIELIKIAMVNVSFVLALISNRKITNMAGLSIDKELAVRTAKTFFMEFFKYEESVETFINEVGLIMTE